LSKCASRLTASKKSRTWLPALFSLLTHRTRAEVVRRVAELWVRVAANRSSPLRTGYPRPAAGVPARDRRRPHHLATVVEHRPGPSPAPHPRGASSAAPAGASWTPSVRRHHRRLQVYRGAQAQRPVRVARDERERRAGQNESAAGRRAPAGAAGTPRLVSLPFRCLLRALHQPVPVCPRERRCGLFSELDAGRTRPVPVSTVCRWGT